MPNMRLFFGDNQSFRLFEPKTWVQNDFFPNTRKLQIFGARTEFGTELCSCVPKTLFSWKFAKKVCARKIRDFSACRKSKRIFNPAERWKKSVKVPAGASNFIKNIYKQTQDSRNVYGG